MPGTGGGGGGSFYVLGLWGQWWYVGRGNRILNERRVFYDVGQETMSTLDRVPGQTGNVNEHLSSMPGGGYPSR